jgi:glycosyltransferase involved in cell wall biosynthesis
MNPSQIQTEGHPEDELAQLSSTVHRLVDEARLGDALEAIRSFVEQVIFNPASTAVVFTSPELDTLCKTVAKAKVATDAGTAAITGAGGVRAGTVILVSELSRAGGHNELIKDILRLELFAAPVRIVQTDCFERQEADVSEAFAAEAGVDVQVAGGRSKEKKFSWLVSFLRETQPETLLLLAHNQDALAVAAAFAALELPMPGKVVYIHHGDHHLSLGASTQDFIHVDPHNIGYFHCRNELGNRCNHYWPMTVAIAPDQYREAPFLATGHLVTCSSGRAEKFAAGSYLHDYFDLIPAILNATGGTHLHIGNLEPARVEQVARALVQAGIDEARFVHVPWVPSVARALLEHRVDLYISSFPLGGGKATLEAMATGVPLLMHQSYRSRFFGGVDIAYPGAFVWRDPQELLGILSGIDARALADHSTRARRHYERFHQDQGLVASCNFDLPQDESVIPPLTEFRPDALANFLDDERAREQERRLPRMEIERQAVELQLYEEQAQSFQTQLTDMTAKAMELESELERSRVASVERAESEKITNLLAAIDGRFDEFESERREAAELNKALRRSLDDSIAERSRARQDRETLKQSIDSIAAEHRTMSAHVARIENTLREIVESGDARSAVDVGPSDPLIAALTTEVQALRASTSWRVTKPLRLLSRMVKKDSADVEAKTYEVPAIAVRTNPPIPVDALGPDTAPTLAAVPLLPGLPPDFVGDVYLKLNPDLLAAGVDAAAHYLSHGQRENRRYALPDFNVTRSERFDGALRTVLLVSHEASRTGAPILSLNLVQVLARKYNVVVLLLGGGALTPAFEATGATVMTASSVRGSPFVANYVVTQICERFDFDFALVNSIESRPVLTVLAEQFVPTISLVHEFASYTRPKEAFREALQWSSEVVFSANVTRDNAFSTFPELAEASATVLPQGKCILPPSFTDVDAEHREGQRLQALIRPKDLPSETLVVLGAGFVQLRKGVDLFIECASRVKRRAGDRKFRFVWIGNGYDPDADVAYSVYLQDQIRRADLTAEVVFLGETSAIEAAYEVADLFLLSSRLDPLPNVAIDAMSQGVPVLCFDRTTGIADFLHDVGLGARCVAGYLDTDDIASKILDFADARASIAEIGAQCRARAGEYFNMTGYVERLEALANEVRSRVDQEAEDCRTILEAGVLRPDFADMPADAPVQYMARRYVRTWASGIGCRKPFPGFHPGIYLERHGVAVAGSDPLADYLRAGQPQGPWNYPVITPAAGGGELPAGTRVALHVHAYYVDLLPEILDRLASNRQKVDLFISVTNPDALEAATAHAARYAGRVVSIRTVPNRGRDIGPFFTEFFDDMKDDYDIVGHFHTKKSVDLKDANMGKRWFAFLADNLLGNENCGMLDAVVEGFDRDRSIGMVFPDDPYISGMETNSKFAEPLRSRLGIAAIPEYFLYPIGTMFWARPAALQPIAALALQWEDYPSEPLPYDGSMLHALERMIALAVATDTWKIATTNVKGVTR